MKYITYFPANTSTISLKGYNFRFTNNIFLSTNNSSATYSLTAVSFNSKLSSANPSFSGFYYNYYSVVNDNELYLYIRNLEWPGYYDAIIMDVAGYTKLSDKGYLIDGYLITPTPTVTPTNTPTPSITPTLTPSPSITPSNTVTPSNTPTQTPTPSITPSFTPTVTPSVTKTVTPTFTPTETPTPTPTITPTTTPTITPSGFYYIF